MQAKPMSVERKIGSPANCESQIIDSNGDRNIKFATWLALVVSFNALFHNTKLSPISNKPI